jgi:hypothetical protein
MTGIERSVDIRRSEGLGIGSITVGAVATTHLYPPLITSAVDAAEIGQLMPLP